MPNSGWTRHASFLGLRPSRLSLYLLCALLLHIVQVNGQEECTTFPCSVSIAIYSLSTPPGVPAPSPPTTLKDAPGTTSSSLTTSTSSSSSSISYSSSAPPPLPPTSTLSSATLSSSALSSPTSSANGMATSGSSNTPASASVPSSTARGPQSPFNAATSGTSTQILLPSFSTTNPVLPSITRGPSLNSSTTNTSSTACGQCSVRAEQVQVYYWPTASVRSNCARASSAAAYQSVSNYAANSTINTAQTITALASVRSTDVVNGFTFTFPSTYVSVVGEIQVSDSCGPIGKTHENPPPVAVQAITTASYASWPSVCRPQGNYVDAVIDTLDLADLACPTWGLSDPFYTTCSGEVYLTATSGAPYNPVILVPTQFLGYDPAWAACTASRAPFLLPCGVYDPPRALQTEGVLEGPQPTAAGSTPVAVSAEPALVSPAPAVAPQTSAPASQPLTTRIPIPAYQPPSNNDPTSNDGQGGQGSNNQSPGNANDPAGDPNSDPGTGSPPAQSPQNAAPEPQPVPQTTINLASQPSATGGIGSIVHSAMGGGASPGSQQGGSSQYGNQGSNVGGNSGSSSGGSSGGSSGSGNQGNQPANGPAFTPHAITALGATLSAINPTAVVVGGKTLSAGGPAFTSNGNYYSLGASGSLVAGTLAPGATQAPAVLTFGGQTYTANSAGQFVIAGKTLTSGGQITISGTPISEAAGGSFAVVGGSTQSLITPAPSQGPALLTFGGSTYTANAASDFVIGSQTLTPGGQITVSGTVLSEAASGSGLVVVGGSSTQVLEHGGAAIVTSAAVMIFDGQTYTADAQGDFTIDGQTLTPGGVITVSGTPISEATGATDVVIGTSTEVLSTAAVTQSAMSFEGGGERVKLSSFMGLAALVTWAICGTCLW